MKQHEKIQTEAGALTEEPLLPCKSSRSSETEVFALWVAKAHSGGKSSASSSIFSNRSAITVSEALVVDRPDVLSSTTVHTFSVFTSNGAKLYPRNENLGFFSLLLLASVEKRGGPY
jgi:hypothetical protein